MPRLTNLLSVLNLLLLPLLAVQAAQAREMVSVNRPVPQNAWPMRG